VHDPVALVLDEPFAGLDPLGVEALSGVITELARDGTAVLFSSHQLDLVEDLCEDVVIIDHGHVVLAGDLQDLRAATPERVVDIRYRGPAPPWSGLAEVQVLEHTDGSVKLKVPRDTAIPALLARMTANDQVTSFSYQPPTLSDLFTEAVKT
jgi:ABC-2 type transport system ATP-binding protein